MFKLFAGLFKGKSIETYFFLERGLTKEQIAKAIMLTRKFHHCLEDYKEKKGKKPRYLSVPASRYFELLDLHLMKDDLLPFRRDIYVCGLCAVSGDTIRISRKAIHGGTRNMSTLEQVDYIDYEGVLRLCIE